MAYFDDDHEDFSDLDIPDHQRHDTMGYAPVTHSVAQPATTASYHRFNNSRNNSSNNVTPNTTVKLWSLRNIELKQLCKFCNFKSVPILGAYHHDVPSPDLCFYLF